MEIIKEAFDALPTKPTKFDFLNTLSDVKKPDKMVSNPIMIRQEDITTLKLERQISPAQAEAIVMSHIAAKGTQPQGNGAVSPG
jgi:hypothetical protein